MRLYQNPMHDSPWTSPQELARSGAFEQLGRLRDLCHELAEPSDIGDLRDMQSELDRAIRLWTGPPVALPRNGSERANVAFTPPEGVSQVHASLQGLIPMLCDRQIDGALRRVALLRTLLILTEPSPKEPTGMALAEVQRGLQTPRSDGSVTAAASATIGTPPGPSPFRAVRRLIS